MIFNNALYYQTRNAVEYWQQYGQKNRVTTEIMWHNNKTRSHIIKAALANAYDDNEICKYPLAKSNYVKNLPSTKNSICSPASGKGKWRLRVCLFNLWKSTYNLCYPGSCFIRTGLAYWDLVSVTMPQRFHSSTIFEMSFLSASKVLYGFYKV